MNETVVYLDLDGVIVDFIGGVIKWYSLDCKVDDFVTYDNTHEIAGMTRSQFWKGLNEDFWLGLEFLPWANDLLEHLKQYTTCILTAPTINTATAKQRWIMKNLPEFFQSGRYLIGPGKSFCAGPDKILIDDSEAKVRGFTQAGGTGILFPAPWNALTGRWARGTACTDVISALETEMEHRRYKDGE